MTVDGLPNKRLVETGSPVSWHLLWAPGLGWESFSYAVRLGGRPQPDKEWDSCRHGARGRGRVEHIKTSFARTLINSPARGGFCSL